MAVFVVRDDKLLLGKRKNVFGDGTWGLPGGHLEYMESLEDCAGRELEEETGMQCSTFQYLCTVDDPRQEDDQHYIHICFRAEGVSGEPEVAEPECCSEWQWFALDDLPENIFIGHRKLIPAFLEGKTFSK